MRLKGATGRRPRCSQRARPARLLSAATGRFVARLFVGEDTWLVAAACEPSDAEQSPPDRRRGGRAEDESGGTGRHGVGQVWASSARKAVGV